MSKILSILTENFPTDGDRPTQISIHPPTPFLRDNLTRILPEWNADEIRVVIVLQRSRFPLVESTPEIEAEKNRLRDRFLNLAFDVASELNLRGWMTDIIDPKTGYPMLSQPGELHHSDATAVATLLNFPLRRGLCSTAVHPDWGSAVYPGVFMSAAPRDRIAEVISAVQNQFM